MQFQVFLYTKTLTSDWKFLVVPELLASSEQNTLARMISAGIRSEFEGVESEKRLQLQTAMNELSSDLQYCFLIGNQVVLLRARRSSREDATGREIWEFAGVGVPKSDAQSLKNCLSELLSSEKVYSYAFEYLDHYKTPPFEPRRSRSYSVDCEQNIVSLEESMVFEYERDLLKAIDQSTLVVLPFSQEGREYLQRLLSNPLVPIFQFAFGPLGQSALVASQVATRFVDPIHLPSREVLRERLLAETSTDPAIPRKESTLALAKQPPLSGSRRVSHDGLLGRAKKRLKKLWPPQR